MTSNNLIWHLIWQHMTQIRISPCIIIYIYIYIRWFFLLFWPHLSPRGTSEDFYSFSVCNRGPTAAQYHPSKFLADGAYGILVAVSLARILYPCGGWAGKVICFFFWGISNSYVWRHWRATTGWFLYPDIDLETFFFGVGCYTQEF